MEENNTCSSASGCSRENCEGCPGKNHPQSMAEPVNPLSSVKKVIGVASGKGGVGKSFITASLAVSMKKAGFEVGIMDADITGPSIPKMFGLHGPAYGTDDGIYAMPAENGIKIMSINLLMDDEEAPVLWRGPVIGGAVKQFWTDVIWGELDYLFIDMPPGTGDVPLTVFQSIPVDGIIIVTSPQELVQMIVKKACHMAEMMNIPVLGIVENFSYAKCPDCGKELHIFGKSHVEEVSAEMSVPVLGRVPIEQEFAKAADEGRFHEIENPWLDAAAAALKP